MGADTTPDDMGLAGLVRWRIREGGAAGRRPGHLEYAGRGLHALDPQASPEGARHEVGHELLGYDTPETRPQISWELLPVPIKPRRGLECGHRAIPLVELTPLLEVREHRLRAAIDRRQITTGDLLIRFPLAGLPLR